MNLILSNATDDEIVTVDLATFEAKFRKEHDPPDKNLLILCRNCHVQYDAPGAHGEPQTSTPSTIPLRSPRSKGIYAANERISDDPRVRARLLQKIRRWASRPHLNVYRIIGIVVRSNAGIFRSQLVSEVARISRNPSGAVASLLTNSGNAYGRIFEEVNGVIRIRPDVEGEVRSFHWD